MRDASATAIQNYEKVILWRPLPRPSKGLYQRRNEQWYEDNEELLQKVEGGQRGRTGKKKYYEVLEKNNGGIVHVKADAPMTTMPT